MDIRLKVFVPTFVLSSLYCGSFFWRQAPSPFVAVIAATSAGFVLASFLTYVVVQRHEGAVARIAGVVNKETTEVSHTREIDLNIPYDKAFQLCRDALGVIGQSDIFEADQASGKFGAVLRIWADGNRDSDRITMQLSRIDDTSTRVQVTSQPTNPLQYIDHGRNLDNVQRAIRFLESVSEASAPQSSD